MQLKRIRITNCRSFHESDVALDANVVVVSEKRVGKSNLLHALRLITGPTGQRRASRRMVRGQYRSTIGRPW